MDSSQVSYIFGIFLEVVLLVAVVELKYTIDNYIFFCKQTQDEIGK